MDRGCEDSVIKLVKMFYFVSLVYIPEPGATHDSGKTLRLILKYGYITTFVGDRKNTLKRPLLLYISVACSYPSIKVSILV